MREACQYQRFLCYGMCPVYATVQSMQAILYYSSVQVSRASPRLQKKIFLFVD